MHQTPPTVKPGFSIKIFLANTAMVCGSLLVTFLAAEILLRAFNIEPKTATALNSYFQYDPQTGWNGRPNAAMRFATTAFAGYTSHGPDGFRKIAKSPQDASTVVWCVGDSGTWGWGVSDGETYVDRLNEKCGPQAAFRNMGICGFATAQQHLLIKNLLEKQPEQMPKLILLLFCPNDLPENVDWQDQTPPRPYYHVENGTVELKNYPTGRSSMSFRSWLKRNSLAYNHLNFYLIMAKRAMKNRDILGNKSVPADSPDDQWLALKHGYRQIRDTCNEHGVMFMPVYLPGVVLRHGAETTPELHDYDERVRTRFTQMARDLSLDVVDISDEVRGHFTTHGTEAPRLSFIGDPHFNDRGHLLIADAIWSRLGRYLSSNTQREATAH
jgi:hypothetical protein